MGLVPKVTVKSGRWLSIRPILRQTGYGEEGEAARSDMRRIKGRCQNKIRHTGRWGCRHVDAPSSFPVSRSVIIEEKQKRSRLAATEATPGLAMIRTNSQGWPRPQSLYRFKSRAALVRFIVDCLNRKLPTIAANFSTGALKGYLARGFVFRPLIRL